MLLDMMVLQMLQKLQIYLNQLWSYSIKTLEKELNTIFINRSNNQFKITEEGKILYANLITVFEKIDNFEKNIKYNS